MAAFIRRILILFVLLLASCSSLMSARSRTELSEEQIALIAGEIEDAVLYSKPPAPASASDYKVDEETGEVTGEFQPSDLMLGGEEIRGILPLLVEAQADTEIMLAAVRGRILRRPAVYELQQRGCLGESRRGYAKNTKARNCSSDRGERDRVAYIILLENRDRRAIHKQLIEALDLRTSDLGRIERIFGEQIHQKAWAGTPLETPEGAWGKK